MSRESNGDFLGFDESTPCEPCKKQPEGINLHSGDGDNKKNPEKNQNEKRILNQSLSKTGAGHNANDVNKINIESSSLKNQLKAEHISSVYPPLSRSKHQTVGHPIIHSNLGMGKVTRGQDYGGTARLKICIGLGVGLIILALTIFGIWASGTFDQKFKRSSKPTKVGKKPNAATGGQPDDTLSLLNNI